MAEPSATAAALATRFWPGALTLVVEARGDIGGRVGAHDGTIGVRCADDELVRRITASVGPVAATSANLHGRPTPTTADEVVAQLPDVLVIDGGPRLALGQAVGGGLPRVGRGRAGWRLVGHCAERSSPPCTRRVGRARSGQTRLNSSPPAKTARHTSASEWGSATCWARCHRVTSRSP